MQQNNWETFVGLPPDTISGGEAISQTRRTDTRLVPVKYYGNQREGLKEGEGAAGKSTREIKADQAGGIHSGMGLTTLRWRNERAAIGRRVAPITCGETGADELSQQPKLGVRHPLPRVTPRIARTGQQHVIRAGPVPRYREQIPPPSPVRQGYKTAQRARLCPVSFIWLKKNPRFKF